MVFTCQVTALFVALTTEAVNSSVALTGSVTLAKFNVTDTAALGLVEPLPPQPASPTLSVAAQANQTFQHFLTRIPLPGSCAIMIFFLCTKEVPFILPGR
jgi:hypothetical protein